jgi:endonuclease/exonuclease/phosphatase family metal-dependent hydrolase
MRVPLPWLRLRAPSNLLCFAKPIFLAALLVCLATGPAWSQDQKGVRIATFNIQNLGAKKVGTPSIRKYLAETIRQFDIVAVQEISDVSNKTPGILLNEINSSGRRYGMLVSERTGQQQDDRTSQEQYGFYFDAVRVDALGSGQLFDDSAKDLFQREPFTARFSLKGSSLTFTITQIHTQPQRAVQEIDSLITVQADVATRYVGESNHILLGDFNGSCSYAKPAQLDSMRIRGPSFYWVVPDSADTTVSPTTKCAYDRIVLTNSLKARLSGWGIASWFTDNKISDHWPVWTSFTAKP